MENNQTDFSSDISKFSNNINKSLKIGDVDINLDLSEYNDIKAIEVINNWETCLGMLGKQHLFKSKEIMKVIYCLLTDCYVINSINGTKLDLDLYDMTLDKFLRIDVIDGKNRDIKPRVFTVCNALVIFDCKDLKNYKIYELYNVSGIKEHYGSKVNFDMIIREMNLEPRYTGSISKLEDAFKEMSVINFKKDNDKIINNLEKFLLNATELESKIQKEYGKFYKIVKMRMRNNKTCLRDHV